jgi:hypothetical protein
LWDQAKQFDLPVKFTPNHPQIALLEALMGNLG